MSEKPILFSGPMVRAILDGRKTMTRRVLAEQPTSPATIFAGVPEIGALSNLWAIWPSPTSDENGDHPDHGCKFPYGIVGDHLWVRESFCHKADDSGRLVYNSEGNLDTTCVHYRADGDEVLLVDGDGFNTEKSPWKSPIHMPRWASRITLEITGVKVERLHDIGKDGRKAHDVLAEGITMTDIGHQVKFFHPDDCPALAFKIKWDEINGKKHPWESNPWVWAITFKRLPQYPRPARSEL